MITEFLVKWWELIVIGLLVADIIVQKTPWKGDDDILAMIKNGIGKIFSMKPGKLPMIFIAFLLSTFLLVGIGLPSSLVTFQWDKSPELDLAGYRIYQTSQPGDYVIGPTSPNLIATIPAGTDINGVVEYEVQIADGTFWFVATAFDTEGLESDKSNEITDTFNGPPGCLIFRFK